jgi:aspartate/methionine/tyrosine aminotransferase
VVAIPPSAFYTPEHRGTMTDNLLRFCFVKDEKTLQAAATRLATLKDRL